MPVSWGSAQEGLSGLIRQVSRSVADQTCDGISKRLPYSRASILLASGRAPGQGGRMTLLRSLAREIVPDRDAVAVRGLDRLSWAWSVAGFIPIWPRGGGLREGVVRDRCIHN